MTTVEAFDAWAESEGILLLDSQREAAHAILTGMEVAGMFPMRATGKTFLLQTVDRYLDQERAV